MQEQGKVKKKLAVPHSLAIIVVVMLLAAALTYIIPAGSYDRTVNEAGQTVVDPNSFHYVEASPVNPLSIFNYVYTGLDNARSIIFVLLAAGGGLGIILDTGVFQAAAGTLSRRTKGKESLVVAVLMTVFCLLCVPINLQHLYSLCAVGSTDCSKSGPGRRCGCLHHHAGRCCRLLLRRHEPLQYRHRPAAG